MWKLGRAVSFLGVHKSDFLCSVLLKDEKVRLKLCVNHTTTWKTLELKHKVKLSAYNVMCKCICCIWSIWLNREKTRNGKKINCVEEVPQVQFSIQLIF